MRWVAAAVGVLWIGSGIAQSRPSIPRASESIEVSIVNVDCVVTDRKGQRVRHLTKDDFVVLEDGKPQRLTNFAEYGEEPAAAASTSAPVGAETARETRSVHRTIIIFADDVRAPNFIIDPIFRSLAKLLGETVRPGDAVMVATFREELDVRQDFTDDVAAVRRALDRIAAESGGVTIDREAEIRAEKRALDAFVQDARDFGSQRNFPSPGAIMSSPITQSGIERAWFELDRTRRKVAALKQLIGTIASAEGRKMLFLLSSHLGNVAGFEYFAAPGPPDSYHERIFNTRDLVASLTQTANAYGVTIYAAYSASLGPTSDIDATVSGRDAQSSSPASLAKDSLVVGDRMDALKTVSGDTGGMAAIGPADISNLISRVRDDFETYYSLAYQQTTHGTKPRRIEVRTTNPAYTVRMRRSAVEKPLLERVADQVSANLVREPSASAIPLTMTFGAVTKQGRGRWLQNVTVRFPASALALLPVGRDRRGAFTVFIQMSRAIGQPPKETRNTIEIGENHVRRAPGGMFTYDFQVLADQYTRRISIGLLDEVSGEIGFAAHDLGGVK